MTIGDKVQHTAEKVSGKAKETVGRATGNEDLEVRGQAQQAAADVKKVGDKAKDAAHDVFDHKE